MEIALRNQESEGVLEKFPAEHAALSHHGDGVFSIRPKDATLAQLQAEVTSVSDAKIEVYLTGDIAGKQTRLDTGEAKAKVHGLLRFNGKGELQSVLVVTDGQYRSPGGKEARSVGGLVEWQLATPAEAGKKER